MRAIVLSLTEDTINYDRTNIYEQIEDIFDDPNNVRFAEFSDETTMFDMVHKILGQPTVGVTACNLWENEQYLYAGYFIDMTEYVNTHIAEFKTESNSESDSEPSDEMIKKIKEIQKNIKMNMFASQISSQHVVSDMIVVKKKLSYTITDNNIKTTTVDVSIDSFHELKTVIESIIVKNGVVIEEDGTMREYRYIMNPIEHLMLSDGDYEKHYVYHEYEVYTYVMMIVADTRSLNCKLNEIATLLANKPVRGSVSVAMYKKPEYNESPPYVSVDINKLKLILNVRKKSPVLTTGLTRSENEYVNFDKLLKLENVKHADKPDLIASDISGELLNIK